MKKPAEEEIARMFRSLVERRDGKIPPFADLLAKIVAAINYTHGPEGCDSTVKRKDWIASLDLDASHAVIADISSRIDEMYVPAVGTLLVAIHLPAELRHKAAIRNGLKRVANDKDGKQAAKAAAYESWKEWQAGRTRYKSGAAFARHIVESSTVESTKTVERWMKDWAARRNELAQSPLNQ